MLWREFKALGTDIIIAAVLKPEEEYLLDEAEKVVLDFDKRFSRFILDSELSKFNNSSLHNLELSATMKELLSLAQKYYRLTRGIFDPTIISSLQAIGYQESFDQQRVDINKVDFNELDKNFKQRVKFSDLKIIAGAIEKPAALKIDLGGIGKGYIVDYLSKNVFVGIKNFWISAGGDILVSGCQPGGESFNIGVQNPLKPDQDIYNIDNNGKQIGIATSGIIKRQGSSGDFKWHHIIDPRTGLSVVNNILAVTIISSSIISADVFAKTVLILGEREGLNFIENNPDLAGVIFTKDKGPLISKRAHLFLT